MTPTLSFCYSEVYDRQLLSLTGLKANSQYFFVRKKKVTTFIDSFQGYEKLRELLKSFARCLHIQWEREVIIYVIPNFHGMEVPLAFSDPTTISLQRCKESKTVDLTSQQIFLLIAHELAHLIQKPVALNLSRFKEESRLTQNHIVTYALLQKVLPPELFEMEIKKSQKHDSYRKAMDIVLNYGSDYLINQATK